jgi:hypothetical protein
VYEKRRSIHILLCYNQWQDRYDDLRKSLGKASGLRKVFPSYPMIYLIEINTQYNNLIILDDLMGEATDSPVVSRLFTQGRHRNASVILLLQNMFTKGKFNMPNILLSSEVLVIGNKLELSENACLIRIESTL